MCARDVLTGRPMSIPGALMSMSMSPQKVISVRVNASGRDSVSSSYLDVVAQQAQTTRGSS